MNKPKEFQTTTQIIVREGFKPVGFCLVFMLLFIFLRLEFLALLSFVCGIFCAFIFRNTERIATYRGEDALITPCDGIIKDISTHDSTTAILVKINIFDNGIFRIPARITHIKSAFRFGLFIKSDKNLQKILNTKHKVSGFWGNEAIFSITLLPEAWNKANIYALDSANCQDSTKHKKSATIYHNEPFSCHSERSEESQKSNLVILSDSEESKKKSQNRDSSLHTSCSAQNDKIVSHFESTQNAVLIGDRLGFMKYGYLLLEIHAPCKLLAQRGDNVFAGETLLGKIKSDLSANLKSDSKANLKATSPSNPRKPQNPRKILGGEQ